MTLGNAKAKSAYDAGYAAGLEKWVQGQSISDHTDAVVAATTTLAKEAADEMAAEYAAMLKKSIQAQPAPVTTSFTAAAAAAEPSISNPSP